MGVPPGAGFIAKWLMLTVALKTGLWIWAVVIIVGGLAAVGYLLRVFRPLMSNDKPVRFEAPPRSMELMVLLLAMLSIFFGLSSLPVFSILQQGTPPELGTYFTRFWS